MMSCTNRYSVGSCCFSASSEKFPSNTPLHRENISICRYWCLSLIHIWHVADALGKCRGDPQFPAQHDVSEKFLHRLNAGNVSHKHKEAHERPQQAVVHLCKQFPVAQQTHRYGGDQTNPVRQHAKYRQQAKHEQQQIPCRRLSRNLFRGSVGFAGTGCFGQKSRQFPQQGVTHGSGWQHGTEEVCGMQLIRRIEV